MNDLLRRADEIPVTMVVAIAFVTMAFLTFAPDPLNPAIEPLIRYGAARAVDIADGEPWRLLTYAFLHGGILHLAMNGHALLLLGPQIERSIGSVRFAVLYVIGAIGGGVGGCLWHHPLAPLVGGSGALFAMLGCLVALLARGGNDPLEFVRQPAGKQVLGNLLLNFAIGIAFPIVSNAAHLGGLLTGFALSYWFLLPPRHPTPGRAAVRAAVAAAWFATLFAVLHPIAREDRLITAWERETPGPRRDDLRAALEFVMDGAVTGQIDDAVMDELATELAKARRGR